MDKFLKLIFDDYSRALNNLKKKIKASPRYFVAILLNVLGVLYICTQSLLSIILMINKSVFKIFKYSSIKSYTCKYFTKFLDSIDELVSASSYLFSIVNIQNAINKIATKRFIALSYTKIQYLQHIKNIQNLICGRL